MFCSIKNYIKRHILLFGSMLLLFSLGIISITTFSEKTTSTIWDGTISSSFTYGLGTKESPYIISNGSDLALFFEYINGENSVDYYNKYYALENNIDLNNIEFNVIKEGKYFSGELNGKGYTISNLNITNGYVTKNTNILNESLFGTTIGATIKNINFNTVNITATNEEVAYLSLISNNSSETLIRNISINNVKFNISSNDNKVSTLINIDKGKNYIENLQVSSLVDNQKLAVIFNEYSASYINNIVYLNNGIELISNYEKQFENIYPYIIENNEFKMDITIDELLSILNESSEYTWTYNNSHLRLKNKGLGKLNNENFKRKSAVALATNAHDSGIDGNTVYVNDLEADKNYYEGLNYTGVWSNTIPSGTSTKYFDADKLIEVKITYDGADMYNSSLVGAVSPINNENENKFVYYKYYPYARNTSGQLLVNENGQNYIHIELIDNPFSKRPIVSGTEYGFNGWVCNQTDDSTANICSIATFKYDDNYYTRYLDIPVTASDSIEIYLNASWIPADVKNNSDNTPNDFNDKSMQPATHIKTVTETLNGTHYTWKQNYYTFELDRTITNRSYVNAGEWYYETNGAAPGPNANVTLTYSRYNNGHRCARNYTCYVYTAVQNGVTEGTIYNIGDQYIVIQTYPNNPSNGSTQTVRFLNTNNSTYMNTETGPYEITHDITASMILDNATAGGFFYQVSNPTANMVSTGNYYNANGTVCTNSTSCTTAYKLIQCGDTTNKSNGNSIYNVELNGTYTIVDQSKYYYLVTRDTNIFKVTNTIDANEYSVSKPYTMTGYNGTDITGVLTVSSGTFLRTYNRLTATDDLAIENIKFDGMTNTGGTNLGVGDASFANAVIYANSQNLKIGRNITNADNDDYIVADSVVAGSNNAISGGFKVIIESGHFNAYTSGTGATNGGTFNEITVFGSDYDRVDEENEKLWFNLGLEGYSHGSHSPGADSLFISMNYVKSGTFGYNANGTPSSDNNAGMYITARAGHYVSGITGAKVEGGKINNIVGGYGFNGSESNNSTFIAQTGGDVRIIYGGAGTSATYGNRIISVTGGNVEYSVLGGSNSYQGSSTDGKLTSDTLVYIGGNATIGTSEHISAGDNLYNVESGSIFGAGGGRSGTNYTGLGTVNNSHVIINGGTILGSVYGGGNYGSTGTQLAAKSETKVDILGGTVTNDIFGGSKSSGFSQNGYKNQSKITITANGGNVGNIYGGSDTTGICYGSTVLNINECNIAGSVYGGGKGNNTYVSNDVDITIGTPTTSPTIAGNVYGGSAYGTVNATTTGAAADSSRHVNVTVENGIISGSVFGGGKGDSSNTPYIKGNITVNINGGSIDSVYGGFDAAGTPQGTDYVYLNGGTIGDAFGGGASTSLNVTNIYLQGATVSNLYGGSDNTGDVQNTNVYIKSGTVDNIFGGNNQGGSCSETKIDITGASVNQAVYGGGNLVETDTTEINIYNTGNTIPEIFGGGNKAGAEQTNITAYNGESNPNNINVGTIYGGSNQDGQVDESNIDINKGTYTTIYGGNNEGGTTIESNINITSGTISTIFGGGNEAETQTTNVDINGGTITNTYGGGNKATTTTTNVEVNNGSLTNIYGGGNEAATTTTNIIITNASNTISNVYGGGNKAGATTTNIQTKKLTSGANSVNITSVFGGSNTSGDVETSNVTIDTGNITTLYGANNLGGNTESSNITFNDGTAGTIYGGGNRAAAGNTTLIFNDGTAGVIYGGGNEATVDTPKVTINDGNIGTIYGGGNAAAVNNSTSILTLGGLVTGNIYGGGNEGQVNQNTEVHIQDTDVNGSVYAGGNGTTATVKGNTHVLIDGLSTIGTSSCTNLTQCSVFGGGNAAYTGVSGTNSSTAIVDLRSAEVYGNVYGGANTSVVYGRTAVNIGSSVSVADTQSSGIIHIHGTVFGGGEANASGSEEYDFSFISVTSAINVNIDGTGYTNLTIDGSIFGSGNASSSGGTSQIFIKNLADSDHPMDSISVQRTDDLILDNSNILLRGATDRTNEYSNVLFSLSRIKDLKLKNNSTIYLENGANLVEQFDSLAADGSKASVIIDDENKTVTKNVDNRIYMYVNKILNIASDENLESLGEVNGMTFFGMYNYAGDDTVNTGIYNKMYTYDDTLNMSDVFNNAYSYVKGLHKDSHDIEVDGFYSNQIDDNTFKNTVYYIEPTPPDSTMYMWLIGKSITEYTLDLDASKYATLGTKSLSLSYNTYENTNFEIVDFNYSGLEDGVQLINQRNIPRVALSTDDADKKMALYVETADSGWLNNGATSFLSSEPSVIGDKKYIGDNTNTVPILLFYLYHSKNIGTSGDLGKVVISMNAVRRIDPLTEDREPIIITITLTRTLFTTNEYEAAMTPGRKYDIFASTLTNISSKSSYSAYFSLFASGATTPYKVGYHRALNSNFVLPVGTKITMIDLSDETHPDYYYHIVTELDEQNATEELARENEIRYYLSTFEKMGSEGSNVYYDDAHKNVSYWNSSLGYASEDFIFIFDFENTNITTDALNKQLLIEMVDADDESLFTVLSIEHSRMNYNIYADNDALIDLSGTSSKNKIYSDDKFTLDLNITYTESQIGSTHIIDTHYFDSKLGLLIYFKNSAGNIVPGTSLLGLNYIIDGVNYAPNIDGTTRIKVADKVGNAKVWVIVDTGTSDIASGEYDLVVETFGSPDGIYYGLNTSDTEEFNLTVVNELYGLKAEASAEQSVIYASTGKNVEPDNPSNETTYTINYNSTLQNPSIRVKMYRRDYTSEYSTEYEPVNFTDYSSSLFSSINENEYIIINTPQAVNYVTFYWKEELITGTYKLEFILYDGDAKVGSVDKYLIIK